MSLLRALMEGIERPAGGAVEPLEPVLSIEGRSDMRVAAIYDIHANLPALESVLEDIRRAEVEQVVVGGDLLPGPMPVETIKCLLNLDIPIRFIQGNGDREVLAQLAGTETEWYRTVPEQWREPVRWTAQQLNTEHQKLLGGWPKAVRLQIRGFRRGAVLPCHATKRYGDIHPPYL